MGARHLLWIKAVGVNLRWNEGWVWIIDIDVQQPGLLAASGCRHKVNRAITGPSRLMQIGWDPIFTLTQLIEIPAAISYPFGVVVTTLPVIAWGMAEFPIVETVI